jgi:hypothetical protein
MILKSQSGPVPEDKPNDSKVQWLLCKGAKTPEKESSQEKGTHTNPKQNIYIYNKGKIVADKKSRSETNTQTFEEEKGKQHEKQRRGVESYEEQLASKATRQTWMHEALISPSPPRYIFQPPLM